ncbi:Helix-turn-helix domain-containing protein [Jatrophihabitans endophyticus]|uniref:Helix-turn-helix domain-containing protein n=1 Tax=Jatrophihabitans endophyticus TaxID=1206085 RepID=A0A1M5MKT3_9ACTN|nr:helix-turn-helix transcriptional regulator [Jatrophihabitans endophyticus]SHG77642.1 Helix-turn-helix domain-containing protein [Jatrophihabitans endophyticus]
MAVLREVVGDTLRGLRMRQRRTLREVSASARVSLGYLSEVERGQKEPSSELLAAICGALEVELSELFAEVSDSLRREEKLLAARRVALVGGGAARIEPARGTDATGTPAVAGSTAGPASASASGGTGARVRALPTVAA